MARGRSRAKEREDDEKVGGFAFFISFLSLSALTGICIYCAPSIIHHAQFLKNWLWFLAGCCSGHLIAKFLIKGHPSVLLHEWKHSLISTLVGNKWRSMKVKGESGHFEYAYSKSNARFNAFISLAPYWLPLFTVIAFMTGYASLFPRLDLIAALVGLAYGADLTLNLRDVSPVQSDITEIRLGYGFGVLYIFVVNLFIFILIGFWVSDGARAFNNLGSEMLQIGTQIRQTIRP